MSIESLDVSRIYSVADQLPPETSLLRNRPFRSLHHTISHAGLVSSGQLAASGRDSLAHHGALFLDKLPKFGMCVLEVLRLPIEDRLVPICQMLLKSGFTWEDYQSKSVLLLFLA